MRSRTVQIRTSQIFGGDGDDDDDNNNNHDDDDEHWQINGKIISGKFNQQIHWCGCSWNDIQAIQTLCACAVFITDTHNNPFCSRCCFHKQLLWIRMCELKTFAMVMAISIAYHMAYDMHIIQR